MRGSATSASPNPKYRSRSTLLQQRASKLISGGGQPATCVEPATIGCQARHLTHIAIARQHLRKSQDDTQIIRGGYILVINLLLHDIPHQTAVRDVGCFTRTAASSLCRADFG
jgi:hypothetical protein